MNEKSFTKKFSYFYSLLRSFVFSQWLWTCFKYSSGYVRKCLICGESSNTLVVTSIPFARQAAAYCSMNLTVPMRSTFEANKRAGARTSLANQFSIPLSKLRCKAPYSFKWSDNTAAKSVRITTFLGKSANGIATIVFSAWATLSQIWPMTRFGMFPYFSQSYKIQMSINSFWLSMTFLPFSSFFEKWPTFLRQQKTCGWKFQDNLSCFHSAHRRCLVPIARKANIKIIWKTWNCILITSIRLTEIKNCTREIRPTNTSIPWSV